VRSMKTTSKTTNGALKLPEERTDGGGPPNDSTKMKKEMIWMTMIWVTAWGVSAAARTATVLLAIEVAVLLNIEVAVLLIKVAVLLTIEASVLLIKVAVLLTIEVSVLLIKAAVLLTIEVAVLLTIEVAVLLSIEVSVALAVMFAVMLRAKTELDGAAAEIASENAVLYSVPRTVADAVTDGVAPAIT
jgi:hypothetical protein